ncbi:C4-dicarboxylate TRAP transporter substrate-binding protein [Paracoccaceae bacterium GXU_MW_L88]
MTTKLNGALALTALLTTTALTAQADTIRATSGFGPAHVLATEVFPVTFEKLGELTDGNWDGQDTPSGLVAPNEMSNALRDGVTEMGTLLMPYFVAEYPEAGLVAELSMLGSNNNVISSAVTEYIATCEPCLAEFSKNGQVYLASDATPLYQILSTEPVESLSDMQGMKLRTGSPFYASLVESLGGEPVQMSSSELFEGLSQGVIDGTVSSAHEIIANRLGDVVGNVTEIDEGNFTGATVAAGKMLWDRMSAEERKALVVAAQYGVAKGLVGFNEQVEEARAMEGMNFITPAEDLTSAIETFNEERLAGAAAILEERGVTDAQTKIDRYAALIEKWEGLVNAETPYEEVARIREEEIWSEIDFNSYGM